MSVSRIARVETFPVVYPTVGRFKFLEDPAGKRTGRPSVLVKLTADDGAAGWGQSVPVPRWSYETLESVTSTIDRYLAPLLVGRDPCDFDEIHAVMNREIAPSFSTGQPMAKAGIDLALHDLMGRLRGQSLSDRWGRATRTSLALSWTVNPASLNDVESQVQEGFDRGYEHFNVKVAPDLRFDVEMCRIVRRLAPEAFLWADGNGGYDEAAALEAAPMLADAGVQVLEQPVAANRLSGFRALKQQSALPILMDEGVVSSVELREFIRLGLLDGVAMKPARCGGLTEARRQIEILQEEGLMFLGSGLTDPDLSLAASVALYAAYGLQYPAALNGPQFLADSVLTEPLKVTQGAIQVANGPGLGVEVSEQRVRRVQIREDS